MTLTVPASTIFTGETSGADVVRAQTYAPILRIHPNETDFPVDPLDFIRNARFRNYRKDGFDEGFSKVQRKWLRNDDPGAEYYDIPVDIINQYGLHPDGKNRVPRSDESGTNKDVFLQIKEAMHGSPDFWKTVSAFFWLRPVGFDTVEYQYWFFSGYDDGVADFNHQGDWEHVRVRVKRNVIQNIDLSQHGSLDRIAAVEFSYVGDRPVVYVAKGRHANYAAAGTFQLGTDKTADGGIDWDTAVHLKPLDKQPWRDYAGAWGEVGDWSSTTGPLGPWFKKD